MFIGVFAGLALIQGATLLIVTHLVASLLLIIIGVLDDKYSLSAGIRIAAQVAVVLIMFYGSGFQLVDIGDPFGFGVITLGPFSLIFTTIVALTVINAYNFVDGADGLAGCLSLVALAQAFGLLLTVLLLVQLWHTTFLHLFSLFFSGRMRWMLRPWTLRVCSQRTLSPCLLSLLCCCLLSLLYYSTHI